MEVLWEGGDIPAVEIARILANEIGWNKNTTYTVIKKCIAKGFIERKEPGYRCKALITKSETQHMETQDLINRMFDGSRLNLFAAFIQNEHLSEEELEKMKKMIDEVAE